MEEKNSLSIQPFGTPHMIFSVFVSKIWLR